jgi:hypothetical protein
MLKNGEGFQKLKDFLQKKHPHLTEEEIEKYTSNLYELGLFLVRLKIEQHSKKPKFENPNDFEPKKPP